MPCYRPVEAWAGRHANDNGKFPIAFGMRDGFADCPLSVPCGKCIGCVKDKATAWSVRCYHESTLYERNAFVTLTYDDEHMPADGRLSVPDAQKFVKRLRSRGVKLRYFLCGEYGSVTRRPHYHALVFGSDFLGGAEEISKDKYFSPFLNEVWGNGHVMLSPVNAERVFYTAGYTVKDIDRADRFHLMSRRPYIGAGWVEQYHDQLCRLGFVVIDGNKLPIPKAYLKRPEWAIHFDGLNDARREYVARMPVDEKVRRREVARSREINTMAQVSRRKGEL